MKLACLSEEGEGESGEEKRGGCERHAIFLSTTSDSSFAPAEEEEK